MRTYVTRPAAICPPERRQQLAHNAAPATGWNPWLWAWVGSEDVARAQRPQPHRRFFLSSSDSRRKKSRNCSRKNQDNEDRDDDGDSSACAHRDHAG